MSHAVNGHGQKAGIREDHLVSAYRRRVARADRLRVLEQHLVDVRQSRHHFGGNGLGTLRYKRMQRPEQAVAYLFEFMMNLPPRLCNRVGKMRKHEREHALRKFLGARFQIERQMIIAPRIIKTLGPAPEVGLGCQQIGRGSHEHLRKNATRYRPASVKSFDGPPIRSSSVLSHLPPAGVVGVWRAWSIWGV